MIFISRRVFLILLIGLALSACSKEDNPTAAQQTPQVTIVVETQNPQIGEPVLFKAEYTGPALTAPVYEWDFGDGSDIHISATDTVSHVFSNEGDLVVGLTVTGGSVKVSNNATITIAPGSSQWEEWTWLDCSIRIAGEYHRIYQYDNRSLEIPVEVDTSYDTTYVADYTFDKKWGTTDESWTGTSYSYYFYKSAIGHTSPFVYRRQTSIQLAANGNSIELFAFDVHDWFTSSTGGTNDSAVVSFEDIPLITSLDADTIVYRIEGASVATGLQDMEYHSMDRKIQEYNSFDDRTLLSILPHQQTRIEVRFTRRK